MANGYSLHIGLNTVDPDHYQGWSGPLAACEFDANDMERIATGRGFEAKKLLTKHATRDAVVGSIREAAGMCNEGDIFMISYSGHGGQVPDYNLDEEHDRQDETWCLYDGQLIDDELYSEWKAFKAGVRILVFSDSCHSGTVVRELLTRTALRSQPETNLSEVFRFMPSDVAARTYRANRPFYDKLQEDLDPDAQNDVKASVLLISGCQDNQYSYDGTFNGLFTGTFIAVWRDGQFNGDYRNLHSAILQKMPPEQSPNFYTVGTPNPTFEQQSPFTI